MTLDDQLLQAGCPSAVITILRRKLDETQSLAPLARWAVLAPLLHEHGCRFRAHTLVREDIFRDETPPWPMWLPQHGNPQATNLASLMHARELANYDELYEWSIRDRDDFWQAVIDRIGLVFRDAPTALREGEGTGVRWLPGAQFNIVDSCLQDSDAPAIVYSTPENGLRKQSRSELRGEVLQVAGGLTKLGFRPGDRIAVLMPMVPESVAIYLGIIAAGCIAVSIADSFAASEIAQRIRIANATGIFCVGHFDRAGRQIDLFTRVCDANAPRAIVLCHGQHPLRDGDLTWEDFLSAPAAADTVAGPADRHINILFSSGTTGDPKAIPWTQTTPVKCAVDGCLHQDIRSGDVVVWPTNIGWMMGPWLIFASLMNGATIGLYHDAPVGENFGQFVEEAGVTMLGVVPTLVRSWRQSGCMESADWSAIRCFSSTGEASSPEDMLYLSWLAGGRPVIEYCGGTEVGGGYITSSLLQPNVPGCFSTPALGSELVILNESGAPSDAGELFLVPPAIGLSSELLNRDHDTTYYADTPSGPAGQRLRRHGDFFERLPGGFFRAGGRTDDTMNVGGIKVSSAEIERVLNTLDDVRETAAITVPPPGGGPEELVVFAVAEGVDPEELRVQMNTALRTGLNPLFKVSRVMTIAALPRTASNKVMRRELRAGFQSEANSSE